MRRAQKFFIISVAALGTVGILLLVVVMTASLMANLEVVRSFIVAKTTQATGGALDYDRLEIGFIPLPHLKAINVQLHRPKVFEVNAHELSVYPRVLPILKGQLSVRQLTLLSPDIKIVAGSRPISTAPSPKTKAWHSLEERIRTTIVGLFSALASIEPGTDLQVEEGTFTLAFSDSPKIKISRINASAENREGDLSFNLSCQSNLADKLHVSANADLRAKQARGQIMLTGLDVRPLLASASLPGGIATASTHARLAASFTIDGRETMQSRFNLQFPSLTIMRKELKLDLDRAVVSGSMDYTGKHLSIAIDALQAAEPAFDVSAAVSIAPVADAGTSAVHVQAATDKLDVATAAAITKAIAGDLNAIRTAFSVAKEGLLTRATYFAGFQSNGDGLQLLNMKASGHLAQGRVTIPGIDADLERMEGDVVYEDRHVAFNSVSGYFKGATFNDLDAAIDWENQSTLRIACPSAAVDVAPLHAWLTGFDGLDAVKNYIETAAGTARLNQLTISGPLTQPQSWAFAISGTPQDIRISGPWMPSTVKLSGGKISYTPGKEQAKDVRIEFLDGAFVSSYQSKGIINPESVSLRINGSMGPATIDWLSTLVPIPDHLQINPPVDLSGINIVWNNTQTLSFMGEMKTAGGVDIYADFTRSPDAWQIRKIKFSDGRSNATASARIQAAAINFAFAGHVEKQTADRLLRNNQTLSGRLEGDFRTSIDTRDPMNSLFIGKLAGEGLHIRNLTTSPINLEQFSVSGSGSQLKIAPSRVSAGNGLLVADGLLSHGDDGLEFDLNVQTDRLDEALIQALEPVGKGNTRSAEKPGPSSTLAPRGIVHVDADALADVRFDGSDTDIQVHRANLCGISTTGELGFSSQGINLHITASATDASLQQTVQCIWNRPVRAQARFDLAGEIILPPTRSDPSRSLIGQMELSSRDGRITHAGVLMKIFSVLNVTEVFTGGKSDLTEDGYGYSTASARVQIGGGKLQFKEILLDGNALKITGQGAIFLDTHEADITLLAAPLKTIDRIVNKVPIINYIAGGSLISIPLRLSGPLNDIKVTPLSPSAVGKGVLNIMKRTLKAPFKLVQSTYEFVEEESLKPIPPADDSMMKGQ